MVNIGVSILLRGRGPPLSHHRPGGRRSGLGIPLRQGSARSERRHHTFIFDGDVKVRYRPRESLPRHESRSVGGRCAPTRPGGSARREEETVTEAVKVNPEQKMLIDGKLVDADSGKTFDNVNPATEEVIGQVADASTGEMHRAIDAARRAFDETDWSTDHAFRKRCLQQLHTALQAEQEELREHLILEVGCPRMTTNGPQLDAPLSDAFAYPAQLI